MIAIRGAITIEKDTPEEIREATVLLISTILESNRLEPEKIISVLFSATKDITSAYPGKFMRSDLGLDKVAILHFQEMEVAGSLPLCIRVMMHYDGDILQENIYLRKARGLRPDLLMSES